MLTALIILFCLVEAWYWFYYFPKAWRGEVKNRQVEDLRFAAERLYGAKKLGE